MSATIKNKAIRGIVWSAVEKFSRQGLMVLFSIIIARQLTPADYGLVAMLNIFMVVAQIFVDSGFVEALIQKQNRTDVDFSTTFWFNIGIALLIYVILFLGSSLIAEFYDEPLLKDLFVWNALIFIINAFRTVQQAKLNISMDFRRQAWISIIAVSVSGFVGFWMACNGYGVWTLVWQMLIYNLLNVVLLWISTGWIPSLVFSFESFKSLFGFGSKLLLSRTLHALYMNGSYLLVGKFYSPVQTGLYSQAITMTSFLPLVFNDVVARVAYPIECELQDDNTALQYRFYQFLRFNAFVTFPLMIGLAVLAEPLVRLLLTEKWMEVVPLIQILCFAWMWQPVSIMTWQILNAKRRSDYCLKSEVVKKVVAFIILFTSVWGGITMLCIGWVFYCVLDLFIITIYTKRLVEGISFWKEMCILMPMLLRAIIMGGIVWCTRFLMLSDKYWLLVGILTGVMSYSLISWLTGSIEVYYLVSLIKKRLNKK